MASPSARSEVEVLADQVALVDAASDFVLLKGQLNQAKQVVEAISRRLEPGAITAEEAFARAMPSASKAVYEAKERAKP